MKRIPWTVIVTLVLLGMNAIFWLGFAIIAALGGIPGFVGGNLEKWILAGLALGASSCLAVLAFFLARRKKAAFYAAATVLTIILVLSFTDQVGIWDILAMLSILAALVLLLKDRKWYLQTERGNNSSGEDG